MKTTSPVKKVLGSLRPYLPLLAAAVVSALISVSLTLYIPVLIGHAIDRIIGKGQVDFADVAQILGYIGIAVGGVTVFQWLMQYFVNLVCYKTVRDLRRAVFRKLNTVPLSYIDTHAHGDLISRVINDVDAVGDGLAQLFLQLFAGIVTIVGTLIFMLMTDISALSRRLPTRSRRLRGLTATTMNYLTLASRRNTQALSPIRPRGWSTPSSTPLSASSARLPRCPAH